MFLSNRNSFAFMFCLMLRWIFTWGRTQPLFVNVFNPITPGAFHSLLLLNVKVTVFFLAESWKWHSYLTGIVHPPPKKTCWKYTHPQALQNVEEFVFIRTDLEKFSIALLSHPWILCSDKPLIKNLTSNAYDSSPWPLVTILCSQLHICRKSIKMFLTSNYFFKNESSIHNEWKNSIFGWTSPWTFSLARVLLLMKPLYFFCLQVITCFGISVLTCRFVGFAVVALLVEINSVFLHLRQVLRMASLAKSTFYRINSMINLGTYVVFRINTLAWMTRWLVLNRDLIPLISYTIGSVGLAIMTVMNIVLFCRLMRSDFMKSSREQEVRKEKEKEM